MAKPTFLRLHALAVCQRCGAMLLDTVDSMTLHAGFHAELDRTKEVARWAVP